MFEGLQPSQLPGALEALLFVTDEPVNAITLADMLEVEPAQAAAALEELRDRLAAEDRGIVLREVAGGWRLFTHPAYHELIERYVLSWDTRKLSQAALETLAIVAYAQPITRAGIASVRGVNSDSSVNSLVEKGLLREAGTEDAPGNPTLYATTQTFLEKFGLRNVADLPPLETYAPDEETKRFIAERLGAVHVDAVRLPGEEGAEGAMGADGAAGMDDASGALGAADPALAASGGEGAAAARVAGVPRDPAQGSLFAAADEMVSRTMPESERAVGAGSAEADDFDAEAYAEGVEEAMRRAMAEALASSVGVVEKIDFNELRFED